jgi:glycosyltransferase involved in cell wall biosynthesis
MNLLVLSQYFWPESFRINEFVESLRAAGCTITVLTGQPNYPDGAVLSGYSARRITREQHASGYMIYRVPVIPRGRGGTLRLAANYTSFVVSASLFGPWQLQGQKFDAIFVYAPSPILQAIPAVLLKHVKKAALVVWVQDLWPQSLEVTGYVKSRFLLGMVARMVRWIYRRCDLLLAQSLPFVASVRKMSGATPVEYFPNPGEAAFLELAQQAPAMVFEPGFNVVFAGNLGTFQALGTLLDAADLLREHRDVRWVVVGSGSRGDWLRAEIERRGLDNVQLPGRFSPAAMPGILVQASALLVSLVRSPTMSQTVPTKIQSYLAAGRPIIASLDGEGARMVVEADAGLACPAEDAAALAQAVLTLKSMAPEQLRRMGEAGRRFYRAHFDSDALALHLLRRLRSITTQGPAGHLDQSHG